VAGARVVDGVIRLGVGTAWVQTVTDHTAGLTGQGVFGLAATVVPVVELGHGIEVRAIGGLEELRLHALAPGAAAREDEGIGPFAADVNVAQTDALVAVTGGRAVQRVSAAVRGAARRLGP